MVLELGDAFEDGDVRIFGKVGGRRRAGCDGKEVDAGVLGGFGIDVAVAGVEDVGLFDAEVLDGAQQACGLWLMVRDIVAADNEVDEFGHVVDVEFFLYAAVRLVGDDADFCSRFLDGAQCRDGAGEERCAGGHVTVGLGAVMVDEMFGLIFIVRADDAFDGLGHGQTDGVFDAFVGNVLVAKFLERDMETLDDGRLGVDKGVVEIEEIETIIHEQNFLSGLFRGVMRRAWPLFL